jgi:aminoglycoside 3-N-acetyltransferase
MASAVVDGVLSVAKSTVLVPAFTYSFARDETFDPMMVPRGMGLLGQYAYDQRFTRTLDPMFSFLIEGHDTSQFAENLPARSFGSDSVFDRLERADGYVLTVCMDAGTTYLHQVEFEQNVAYRFEKVFTGLMRIGKEESHHAWTSYVRDSNYVGSRHSFGRLTRDLSTRHLSKRWQFPGGHLDLISVLKLKDFTVEQLKKDPEYLILAGQRR